MADIPMTAAPSFRISTTPGGGGAVPRPLESLYSTVPLDLRDADERLHRYGRWAADRAGRKRCGSAERYYTPGRGEVLESRREAREELMHPDDALACQRALARVPDRERVVLTVLYVPRRVRPEVQLRLLRIPPRLAAERHLCGLRMFDNLWRVITAGTTVR